MIQLLSKDNCSYCAHAREYLIENQIPFVELKLDKDFNREFVTTNYPTAKTYPVIIFQGEYIGGFVDLKEKHSNGEFFND